MARQKQKRSFNDQNFSAIFSYLRLNIVTEATLNKHFTAYQKKAKVDSYTG